MDRDLAIIGVGYWGKNLFRVFHQMGVLHSFCDSNESHIKAIQKDYPEVHFEANYEKLIESPEIKKVVIATPTRFHYSMVKKALLAKKDVFVEKAMCETLEQAKEVEELSRSLNRICMVGHLLHYHPAIQEMKKRVRANEIGDLKSLTFNRLNFGSRGVEKSALIAFAPHDLSILLSFCPEDTLEDMSCFSSSFYSSNLQDESVLMLQFKPGIRAKIHVSWLSPYPERKCVLIGNKGTLVFDDLKDWSEKLTFWPTSITKKGEFLNFDQKASHQIVLEPKEPLLQEAMHFISCCSTRKEPITNAAEGLSVLSLLEQAQKSSKQRPFTLNELAQTEKAPLAQ